MADLKLLMFQSSSNLLNEYGNNCLDDNENSESPQIPSLNYYFSNFNQISLYEDGDEDENDNSQIPSSYLIQSKIEKTNISKGMKSTTIRTTQKKEQYNEPELYTLNDIIKIFNEKTNQNEINEIFKTLSFSKYIEEDLQLTKKKTRRDIFEYDNFLLNKNVNLIDNKTEKKRGRQTTIPNRIIHDKMSPDNIIKKVKSSIFNFIRVFLNNIINLTESYSLYKIQLLKLDYKYVNKLKKEQEIEFLNMPIKDILSKDISPKYQTKYLTDYNKRIIEKILKNINVDENKDYKNKDGKTILFVFNMTLRDWLDIFTHKKSAKNIINEYNNIDIENINFEKIEKSWVGVDKLLDTIRKKNDDYYMALFIICLYNYERWFYLKKSRNYMKKEKEI